MKNQVILIVLISFLLTTFPSVAQIITGTISPSRTKTIASQVEAMAQEKGKAKLQNKSVHRNGIKRLPKTTFTFKAKITRKGVIISEMWPVKTVKEMELLIAKRDGKRIVSEATPVAKVIPTPIPVPAPATVSPTPVEKTVPAEETVVVKKAVIVQEEPAKITPPAVRVSEEALPPIENRTPVDTEKTLLSEFPKLEAPAIEPPTTLAVDSVVAPMVNLNKKNPEPVPFAQLDKQEVTDPVLPLSELPKEMREMLNRPEGEPTPTLSPEEEMKNRAEEQRKQQKIAAAAAISEENTSTSKKGIFRILGILFLLLAVSLFLIVRANKKKHKEKERLQEMADKLKVHSKKDTEMFQAITPEEAAVQSESGTLPPGLRVRGIKAILPPAHTVVIEETLAVKTVEENGIKETSVEERKVTIESSTPPPIPDNGPPEESEDPTPLSTSDSSPKVEEESSVKGAIPMNEKPPTRTTQVLPKRPQKKHGTIHAALRRGAKHESHVSERSRY